MLDCCHPETLFSVYQTLSMIFGIQCTVLVDFSLFSFKNRKHNRPKLQPPYCFETWPPNQKKTQQTCVSTISTVMEGTLSDVMIYIQGQNFKSFFFCFFFNILKLPVNSQVFLTTHVKSAVIFGSISRKTKTEDLRELIKIHVIFEK